MIIIDHPYLEGVKCREDGAIQSPPGGKWRFGTPGHGGYLVISIHNRILFAHRVICEAFHGVCPQDKCQVDHIDRNPANNRPENLHWVSRSENQRNRKVSEESLRKFGVSCADDKNAYEQARRNSDDTHRERNKAIQRKYRETHRGRRRGHP